MHERRDDASLPAQREEPLARTADALLHERGEGGWREQRDDAAQVVGILHEFDIELVRRAAAVGHDGAMRLEHGGEADGSDRRVDVARILEVERVGHREARGARRVEHLRLVGAPAERLERRQR